MYIQIAARHCVHKRTLNQWIRRPENSRLCYALNHLCNAGVEVELNAVPEITAHTINGIAKKTNTNPAVLAQCLYAKKKITETMVGRFEEEVVVG
ncbi:MAG: hypothetical protein L6Q81_05140 [Bacteroidia bacterium]|nr:hypothetical protein [Bacteroidia bacterium]